MGKNFDNLAVEIVNLVGGKENIVSLTHCITRLRFVLKDESIAKKEELQNLNGVLSVIQAGGQYQVVIGNDVDDVYQAIGKIGGIRLEADKEAVSESDSGKKKNILSTLMDTISGIFMPIMPAMIAAGLLKAIVIMLSMFGLLSEKSSTYIILYALSNSFFYFMPFFLGASAAKKFGSNIYLGMIVAATFLYPTLLTLFQGGKAVTFVNIPVHLLDYSNTVIPVIFAVYAMAKIEKVFKRLIPKIVAGIFVPALTLLVTVPISLIVIGPVINQLSSWVSLGITSFIGICPPLIGFILGASWSVIIIFGLHWAIITVAINNMMTLGMDKILPITFPVTFSQAGAVLGVALRTRDKELKENAFAAFFSAFVGGISEPAIYGVNLKYKRPFIIACIFNGISGAIIATAGGTITDQVNVGIFTLPVVYSWPAGSVMLFGIALSFIGTTVVTFLFGFSDKMLKEKDALKESAKKA